MLALLASYIFLLANFSYKDTTFLRNADNLSFLSKLTEQPNLLTVEFNGT